MLTALLQGADDVAASHKVAMTCKLIVGGEWFKITTKYYRFYCTINIVNCETGVVKEGFSLSLEVQNINCEVLFQHNKPESLNFSCIGFGEKYNK
jgi:hypothetical protein